MDRVFHYLMARPIWFAIVVAVALALLPVAVWLDLRHLSDVALDTQAKSLDQAMTAIRSYYGRNVVGRVQAVHGEGVTPRHDYLDTPGGIPIPATLSIELGDVIGASSRSMRYRFLSDYAFTSRPPHVLDGFEKAALAAYRANPVELAPITEVDGSLFDRHIRLASPVVMTEACVGCHNTHPESPKRDWKVGDIRGLQEVDFRQPIAANLLSFKYLLTYFAGAALFGVAFASMQWRQARTFGRMNRELEEANGFLASISLKISKYLSPQVYRSIFSGERDVTISTERKKLTIFFSDIKDFTVTSERLQPEELTDLLNEYFTEMSKIALAHGATVDKFIGDAILAFFGDPETRGTREDARACVRMAIAMQRRLGELNRAWRRRGIEKPFEARMGINTGYCNVGNFGSADRMDYTIIGAEANLAARLEQAAEPGGIVMSYETYVHVEDEVRARPLPPITLKGISRPVIPYVVEGSMSDAPVATPGIIDEYGDGARVFLDLDRLGAAERERMRRVLLEAMQALAPKGAEVPGPAVATPSAPAVSPQGDAVDDVFRWP